jgi:hypothetical protein
MQRLKGCTRFPTDLGCSIAPFSVAQRQRTLFYAPDEAHGTSQDQISINKTSSLQQHSEMGVMKQDCNSRCITKDPTQTGLAEDDDVIEAFPTDRADQPLRMPILPG